jgi:uncharacterized protein YbjT (DUF2867 family)
MAIAVRLAADGHTVVGIARTGSSAFPVMEWINLDIARATNPKTWLPLLRRVDAVVNCAGTLQDSPHESAQGVHFAGATALFEACEQAGVRKVIHFSAVGVERAATPFSESKLRGEESLISRDLDWVILRPSVVIGRNAYGGSALLRGLAALSVLPAMPGAGQLQPVYLDDVIETVVFFLNPDAPARQVLELAGPQRRDFNEMVRMFRRWMRWRPAWSFTLPGWLATTAYRAGDAIAMLGWKPPIRTTAQAEIRYGAVGDPSAWSKATGIVPRDVENVLAREPASVQERWFARIYVLKPLVFGIFSAFWIVTGLISLGPGWDIGISYVIEGGATYPVAAAATIAGALADILIGLAILYRPTTRYGLYAALLISITYAIIGTILVPRLWLDPLGPMLKIWPIMVLNLMALAIVDDR